MAPFSQSRGRGEAPAAGVLLLADTPDQNGIEALMCATPEADAGVWVRQEDCDTPYLIASGPPYPLIAIAGFQVVTREGLEVLGLMMPQRPCDGRSLRDTIDEILAAHGLPVLPWGVGKWFGRRGRLVAEVIDQPHWRGKIALADNANRPAFWPTPRLLRRGRKAGLAVLHGSDPLPVRGDAGRIGSAGVIVPAGPLDGPVAYLRQVLRYADQVQVFGRAMPAAGFVYRQAALRVGSSP